MVAFTQWDMLWQQKQGGDTGGAELEGKEHVDAAAAWWWFSWTRSSLVHGDLEQHKTVGSNPNERGFRGTGIQLDDNV